MYYVYILYSDIINEYYCGQCNNIVERLYRHNSGETRSIKHGRPWRLIGYLAVATRSEAIKIERSIKQRGIKRWLSDHHEQLKRPSF